jgi:DNA-binding FadR family transcriptional regulator
MTQNPLIAGMYQVLADYFHAVAMRVPHGGDATETAGWQHRAIAQAFKQRDAEQARALLRQHLHNMCESTPEEKS